jgi:hypothetical protein
MMSDKSIDLAIERAAQIMAGTVTYVGHERQLARALIELLQRQGVRPEERKPVAWLLETRLRGRIVTLDERDLTGDAQLILGIEKVTPLYMNNSPDSK